jgi:hypothetical protein
MTKPVPIEKLERNIRRKANLVGKISYVAPCTKKDINYWYRRNTLVYSILLAVFTLLIYAALFRETELNRFNELRQLWTDDPSTFNFLEFIAANFFAELFLSFFALLWIFNLFSIYPIKVVGEKGFAFIGVKRNYTASGANIALFEYVQRLTITIPRGGIGKHYKWYGDSRISVFDYNYHPFLESTHFINAALESWQRYRILREHRVEMENKRSKLNKLK